MPGVAFQTSDGAVYHLDHDPLTQQPDGATAPAAASTASSESSFDLLGDNLELEDVL